MLCHTVDSFLCSVCERMRNVPCFILVLLPCMALATFNGKFKPDRGQFIVFLYSDGANRNRAGGSHQGLADTWELVVKMLTFS